MTYQQFVKSATNPITLHEFHALWEVINRLLVTQLARPCPQGWATASAGASKCTICAAGYQVSGSSCVACLMGFSKAASGNGTSCSTCSAGYYTSSNASLVCLLRRVLAPHVWNALLGFIKQAWVIRLVNHAKQGFQQVRPERLAVLFAHRDTKTMVLLVCNVVLASIKVPIVIQPAYHARRDTTPLQLALRRAVSAILVTNQLGQCVAPAPKRKSSL